MFERLISMFFAVVVAFIMGGCETNTVEPADPGVIDATMPSESIVDTIAVPDEPDVIIPGGSEQEYGSAEGSASAESDELPENDCVEEPELPTQGESVTVPPASTTPSVPEIPPTSTDDEPESSEKDVSGGVESEVEENVEDNNEGRVESEPAVTEKPAAPHVHSYARSETAATCTATGRITYTCSCGDSYSKTVGALEHDFRDSYYYFAPLPDVDGKEGRICQRCGYDDYVILEKLPPLATNEDAAEIEALIIQYINEYRAAEGACAMEYMVGCDPYTQYRAEQMAAKGYVDHDRNDRYAAAEAVQYGVYVDPSLYGIPGDPYRVVKGQEACGVDSGNDIENVARTLASGFHSSTPHWGYLGDDVNKFVSVGVTKANGRWFCCVVVSLVNLDENPSGI